MRVELHALIGVGWGECSPKRIGYHTTAMPSRILCNGKLEKSPKASSGLASTPPRCTPLCKIRDGIPLFPEIIFRGESRPKHEFTRPLLGTPPQ